LPGFIINTVDGGLAARRPPKAKSTLIFGTADQGVADSPYQVTDPSLAAKQFGFNGNLVRAMSEALAYSDNVILFRMGTQTRSSRVVSSQKPRARARTSSVAIRNAIAAIRNLKRACCLRPQTHSTAAA
jgi:hypothetical protein